MSRVRAVRPLVGATLACLLLLTGCSSLDGTGNKGFISGNHSVVLIDEGDRSDPVDLTGESLTGEPIDVADYRGKVVVVNVWWSGCGPCRTEMPLLAEASTELGDDVAFVGINIRDSSQSQGLAFSDDAGVEYPSIYDPNGQAMLAFSGKVSLVATPSTVFLDADGRVAAMISGDVPSKQTLLDVIEDVSGKSADG